MVPLFAEADFPWIIVAMLFIAFFRWIMDRISGKPAELEIPETAGSPAGAPPPSPGSRTIDPEEELRRFFDSLQGEPETAPPPPPRVVTRKVAPPPPPQAAETVAESRARRAKKPLYTTPEMVARLDPRFASLLDSRLDLQNAFVLKEVFDRPLSLRDEPPMR